MFQIISDVHLETNPSVQLSDVISPCAPYLILAGDIGNPKEKSYLTFIKDSCKNFRKVFVLNGNHEYYGSTVPETDKTVSEICSMFGAEFMQKRVVHVDGVDVIGCTLWTHIDPFDYRNQTCSDHLMIKDFSTLDRNDVHVDHKEFLKSAIHSSASPLVVTHHVPSLSLASREYKTRSATDLWMCECDHLIRRSKAWVYGHTHVFSDTVKDGCRLVCNPYGYPDEADRHKRDLIIRV